MKKTTEAYTVDSIQTPDQIALTRKRIGVYLSGTDSAGATTGLRELIDNGFDEGLMGHGDTITVRLFADGSAEVEDHGRGLPIDTNAQGVNGIILTVGTIGSGGKFSGNTVSGGLNGMGASAANFSSKAFKVSVYRGGKLHRLDFREGIPGHFAKEDDPDSKFTPSNDIKVSKDPRPAAVQKAHPTGTKIRYWLDHTVFVPEAVFLAEEIKSRLKATCFLLPHMTAIVEDYRTSTTPIVDKYHFNSGIEDMVGTLTNFPLIGKPTKFKVETSFTEMTNVLKKDGRLNQEEVVRPVTIEMAFGYTGNEETVLKSYVNLIQTSRGGTHEAGLWRAFSRVLVNHIKAGKEAKYLKAKEEPPILEDVRDGFVGVISLSFPEPVFSGQAKEELKTPQMTSLVSQGLGDALKSWLENSKNKNEVKKICLRIVEAARIRIASKAQKDTARKKSALETSTNMPSKLVECANAGAGSVGTELLIVEGDSALGGMRSARMSEFQALLPLRGKVLNARKATLSQILANVECANMIQAIGAGSGKSFDIKDMRYDRIVVASDADLDGAHISVLLITFFSRVMPEIIRAGKLFLLIPPLFEIKGKVKGVEEFHYAANVEERDIIIADLEKRKAKGIDAGRNKGLGEMDPDPIWDTLLNPENRRVKQITIEDAEAADHMLELAMGSEVPPRREWIVANHNKIVDLI